MPQSHALKAPTRGAVFVVTADRCPQILCRLLGLVAQQNQILGRVDAITTRNIFRVTFCVPEMEARHATIIAEKMRQFIGVRTVKLQAPSC